MHPRVGETGQYIEGMVVEIIAPFGRVGGGDVVRVLTGVQLSISTLINKFL